MPVQLHSSLISVAVIPSRMTLHEHRMDGACTPLDNGFDCRLECVHVHFVILFCFVLCVMLFVHF